MEYDRMDYIEFSLLEDLSITSLYNNYKMNELIQESKFIIESLNSGYISVFEAEKKQSLLNIIIQKTKDFFNKIINIFRIRSIKKCEKYKDMIEKNRDAIKNGNKDVAITASPYWKADWQKDLDRINSAMNNAINSISNKTYNYDFIKAFISVKDDNILSSDNKEYFKNYFRFGVADATEVKPVKLSWDDLDKLTDSMMSYIINFDKLGNNLEKLNKKLQNSLAKIQHMPLKEQLSDLTFLNIENKYVYETQLQSCIDYLTIVTEDEKSDDNKDNNENNQDTKTDNKENKPNPTQVTSDNDKSKNKPDASKDSKNKTENNDSQKYVNNVMSLLRLLVSAYITAAEERFSVYMTIIKKIAFSEENPDEPITKDNSEEKKKTNVKESYFDINNILELI